MTFATLAATVAQAQTVADPIGGTGTVSVLIGSGTQTSGLVAYNKADIADTTTGPCAAPKAISISVTFDPALVAGAGLLKLEAYAWWDNYDSDCAAVPSAEMLGGSPRNLTGSISEVVFPDDFTGTFDEKTAIESLDAAACTAGTTVASTTKRLCIGLDQQFPGAVGTFVEDDVIDDTGWVTFEIDTEPPPIPDPPVLSPLDGEIKIEPNISANGEANDIESWNVMYREAKGDGLPCDQWSPSDVTEQNHQVPATGGSLLVTELVNGTTYELCIWAIDDAGNVGLKSPVTSATPVDECDFFECYPGGAPSGYCGAMGAEVWGSLGALLLLGLRRRRHEAQR